ncbi:hypothetical protein [Botrimarina sp.]|uniref:hypothetical protein n=1 Tax=Botrimarina sp. TaxID=2795802 RepID=UPI0032F01C93
MSHAAATPRAAGRPAGARGVDDRGSQLPGTPARLLESLGDRVNPILVKETRQALKSRQFVLWFVLLLVASWVATIAAVAVIGPSIYYVSAGGYLLKVYYVILCVPLVVVTPFSAYRSLAAEHEENTRDLIEVSTLTPRQVINGKLGSAALQTLIYGSALAPCIAFTYLLRGVSLLQIGVLLAGAVLASVGLSAVGLLVAAGTRQKYAQVVMSVALAGGLFMALWAMLAWAWELLRYDTLDFRGPVYWAVTAVVLSLYATTLALVYAAAVSLTTFSSANRSTPLRLALLAQQTVFVAWVAGGVAVGMPFSGLRGAFFVAAAYWFAAGAALCGEQPTLSHRVRRSLPQSLLGRALGSWLQPGGGSGYVFTVANLAAVAVLTVLAGWLDPRAAGGAATELAVSVGLLVSYIVAYLGLGRLVVTALRKVTEVSLLGCFLIQVLIALAGSGLPYVVDTLTDRVRVENLVWLNAMSPTWNLSALEEGAIGLDRGLTLLVTVGAAALAIGLVNLTLAGREARQLRVGKPRRVVQDELEQQPPPEAAPTNPWGDRPRSAGEAAGQ